MCLGYTLLGFSKAWFSGIPVPYGLACKQIPSNAPLTNKIPMRCLKLRCLLLKGMTDVIFIGLKDVTPKTHP